MKRRIRIQGMLIFFAVILIILLSKLVFPHWGKESLDEFLDALGIGLVLFGFTLRIVARGYKRERSYNGNKLVKDGPYYLMQHPMYFGTLLIGIGIILVLFELWTFPFFLIIYLSIYIPQVKKEEKKLFKYFGQDYENYCRITPKYFPKISHLLNLREHIYLKLSWIKEEFVSLTMVIIAILAVEVWEDVRLFGHEEVYKELLELFAITASFVIIIFSFLKKERKTPKAHI